MDGEQKAPELVQVTQMGCMEMTYDPGKVLVSHVLLPGKMAGPGYWTQASEPGSCSNVSPRPSVGTLTPPALTAMQNMYSNRLKPKE